MKFDDDDDVDAPLDAIVSRVVVVMSDDERATLDAVRDALARRLREDASIGGDGETDADGPLGDDEYRRVLEALRLSGEAADSADSRATVGARMRDVFAACEEDGDDVDDATFEARVRAAVDGGEDVNGTNDDGETALHAAALYGKLSHVRTLLRVGGADVAVTDESGGTALHDASASGHVEVVRALTESARARGTLDALVRAEDEDEETALHHAARGEHGEVVKLLLELGADATKRSSAGATARDLVEDAEDVRALL